MDALGLVDLLFDASTAANAAIQGIADAGPTVRPGQYGLDVAADDVAVAMLVDQGMSVMSEESGLTEGNSALIAVLDPIDGSTNAYRGIPFYSTSICVFDEEGPWIGTVLNHGTGQRFHAVRGMGAWRDGASIHPSPCQSIEVSVVGLSGLVSAQIGSWQHRALGCASLEFCGVADGSLDAYVLGSGISLRPWDYLAGLLICVEAGAAITELDQKDPWVTTATERRPIAAATPQLLSTILASTTV